MRTEKNRKSIFEKPLAELISIAGKIRKKCVGDKLELCSILNAKSGLCGEDCKFCAQSSRHRTGIETYPLKNLEEILESAKRARSIGAERFGIVTSGNRLVAKELESIKKAIREIRKKVGITVCASLGVLSEAELKALKDAGLGCYHHNIETSRRFYPRVVSTHKFAERINTIKNAKKAGLEVCSGGIIGMGESWQDRLDMANLLNSLDVDSVPINILVPIKGTPFESVKPISCKDAIKTISIFRIILKNKTIKLAAGRESVLRDFQGTAFMAGANGMLIGGYLTIKGRDVESDRGLIGEIRNLWKE